MGWAVPAWGSSGWLLAWPLLLPAAPVPSTVGTGPIPKSPSPRLSPRDSVLGSQPEPRAAWGSRPELPHRDPHKATLGISKPKGSESRWACGCPVCHGGWALLSKVLSAVSPSAAQGSRPQATATQEGCPVWALPGHCCPGLAAALVQPVPSHSSCTGGKEVRTHLSMAVSCTNFPCSVCSILVCE